MRCSKKKPSSCPPFKKRRSIIYSGYYKLILTFLGEKCDRVDITLPGYQEALIELVATTAGSKPVALVLINVRTFRPKTQYNNPIILSYRESVLVIIIWELGRTDCAE